MWGQLAGVGIAKAGFFLGVKEHHPSFTQFVFHSRTERKGEPSSERGGGDFKGHHKREGAGGLWEKKKLSPKSTFILRKFVGEGEKERRPIFPSLSKNKGHDFSTAEPPGKQE